jgi:peroxiredoxin
MMKLLRRSLIAAAVAAPVLALANANVDAAAPAFTATTADGKTVNLADYKGKTVVLEWTNHDCPFVKKHYESGNIPKLQKEAAAQGVVWLQVISSAPGQQGHVNAATAKQVNDYRESKPAGTVLDESGAVGKLYGARTTPHIFVIDQQGKLAYKGGIDSIPSNRPEDIAQAEPYARNAIQATLKGQQVAKASTQPYGCSVKYSS